MKIEIRRWDNDEIIVCGEYESIKDCLERNKGKSFYRADLCSANLNYAKIKEPTIFTDLYYFLTLQPDITMRAWKHLKDGKSPYQHKEYEVGEEYTFNDLNKDKFETCGKGGNIATLNWCLKDSAEADEFIEVEVNTKDLIVPYFSDGKFRVSKFKVLRKINRKEAVELIEKTMA